MPASERSTLVVDDLDVSVANGTFLPVSIVAGTAGATGGALYPVGTAVNGTDTTVDATAGGVTLLAANQTRKAALIQNVGAATMRVTIDGTTPTATHGIQVVAGATLRVESPYCPTTVIKATRETATSTTANATEIRSA